MLFEKPSKIALILKATLPRDLAHGKMRMQKKLLGMLDAKPIPIRERRLMVSAHPLAAKMRFAHIAKRRQEGVAHRFGKMQAKMIDGRTKAQMKCRAVFILGKRFCDQRKNFIEAGGCRHGAARCLRAVRRYDPLEKTRVRRCALTKHITALRKLSWQAALGIKVKIYRVMPEDPRDRKSVV